MQGRPPHFSLNVERTAWSRLEGYLVEGFLWRDCGGNAECPMFPSASNRSCNSQSPWLIGNVPENAPRIASRRRGLLDGSGNLSSDMLCSSLCKSNDSQLIYVHVLEPCLCPCAILVPFTLNICIFAHTSSHNLSNLIASTLQTIFSFLTPLHTLWNGLLSFHIPDFPPQERMDLQ